MANYLFRDSIHNYRVALILDPNHKPNQDGNLSLVLRFSLNNQKYYLSFGESCNVTTFAKLCALSDMAKSGKLAEERNRLKSLYEEKVGKLKDKGDWKGLDFVRIVLTGKSTDNANSFLQVWQTIIKDLLAEGRFTTAESYQCAYNSFYAIVGKEIQGFNVTIEHLRKWCKGMDNGLVERGVLIRKPIAEATKGIYLRTCRVVWNECKDNMPFDYPFSNEEKKKLIRIPTGATRKDERLSVEQMTELYKVFVEKRYPEKWTPKYKRMAHYSLGLFLFQYLGNGMNLADMGLLRYDQFYFLNDEQAFKFIRKKTERRSKKKIEVVVPITEALKNVIEGIKDCNDDDFIAVNEPFLNCLVFPYILKGATTPEGIRQQTKQENSNVADRVQKICKEVLSWNDAIKPSGTWCRHSFATNLAHTGVDKLYISECMGHSCSEGNTTDLYIDRFPLETQMEYNGKLLNLEGKKDVQGILSTLTEAEKAELLKQLLGK